MVRFSFFLISLIASRVRATPLNKRIAQTIADSTAKWEQACLTAGGGQQCNPVSVTAFSTLLAAASPCDQQNAADQMIDLAKQLNNDADMIRLTQIFVQQPRNTPTSQSVPYCQTAPKNSELNGLFQCQFAGANPTVFVGGISVGKPGTIPFGKTSSISPPGSCPANSSGPIADGTQLVDVTPNPGVGSDSSASSAPVSSKPSSASTNNPSAGVPKPSSTNADNAPVSSSSSAGNSGSFQLQNGKDAQALNAKFATLNANSPCSSGDQACIGDSFAQCVNGKFVTTQCSAPLGCFALPLVNSKGTSIACTTQADAQARISASGATGGVTGAQSAPVSNPPSATSSNALAAKPPSSTTTSSASGFLLQNGKDAQQLNAKFASLTESSPCTSGEEACLGSDFAQCVDGKFVTTSCGASLTCAALPLVNKPGTSITCTTAADAAARIQATGATGGVTGS